MSANGYVIDNEVFFIPSEKKIRSRTTNKTQTLHAPAVRCLQLLIESKETVTQARLYKAGWGDDALKRVSTATYYQCFVNLRKQLREIGYSNELLITVPKEGMKINDAIEIASFIPLPEKQEVVKTKPSSLLPGVRLSRLLIVTLILACLGSLVFVLSVRDSHHVTLGAEQYRHFQELPECVYAHSAHPTNVDVARINQFIVTNNLSCPATGLILIHQGEIRSTVFHCTEAMSCYSLTYMNKPL